MKQVHLFWNSRNIETFFIASPAYEVCERIPIRHYVLNVEISPMHDITLKLNCFVNYLLWRLIQIKIGVKVRLLHFFLCFFCFKFQTKHVICWRDSCHWSVAPLNIFFTPAYCQMASQTNEGELLGALRFISVSLLYGTCVIHINLLFESLYQKSASKSVA